MSTLKPFGVFLSATGSISSNKDSSLCITITLIKRFRLFISGGTKILVKKARGYPSSAVQSVPVSAHALALHEWLRLTPNNGVRHQLAVLTPLADP